MTDGPAYSDRPELLAAAAEGDPDALRALYDAYGEMLYRVAYRLTESSADARDVVQDVFLGLPEALGSFAGEGSFEGWLKRVATRTVLMLLRQRKNRSDLRVAFLPRRPGSPPDVSVDAVALERAVAELPSHLRTVVVLRHFEEMSHREIAETVGITEQNSRVRYHRALKRLRAHLQVEE